MTKMLSTLTLTTVVATILWCLAFFPPGAILALAATFYITDRHNSTEVSAFSGTAMCLGGITGIAHLMLS